jgi:hypothetical protein
VTAGSPFSSRDSRVLVELTAVTIRFRSVAGKGLPSALRHASLLTNRLFVVRRISVSQDENTTMLVLSSTVFTTKHHNASALFHSFHYKTPQ